MLVGTSFGIAVQEELDDMEDDLDRGGSENTEEDGDIEAGVVDRLRQEEGLDAAGLTVELYVGR